MSENKNLAENNPNTHISFSEFSLYNQCGHRHLLEKYLAIATQPPSIHLFFGNSIHESIEMGLTKNLTKDEMVLGFRSTFQKNMKDNMTGMPQFFEMDDFSNQGEDILRNLDLDAFKDEYEICAVEEPLYEQVYKKFYFKGFVDLRIRHKKTKRYKVVDWKSSGEPWNVDKKKKDEIFLCQMPLYKFFCARKNNIPLDEIDCQYVVLNRLKDKKNPQSGFGGIDFVDIESSKESTLKILDKLVSTIKKIHIDKDFSKIKHTGSEKMGCMFCPYKGGSHILCDATFTQGNRFLKEHNKL